MAESTAPLGAIRHLGPAERQPMRDRVVSMLIDAIRSGEYGESDRLPSERELAAEIGVSRAIVSEAIDELETAGVLRSRRGRGGGTFVVSVSNLPVRAQRIAGEHREVMSALLEAREAVEVAVVFFAARRARVTDLRELRKLYEHMGELVDEPQAYAEAAMRFNLRVADASGNPFLVELVRMLVNEQATLRQGFSENPTGDELRETSLKAHAAVLDALADGDPEQIGHAVAAHMEGIRKIYLGPAADLDRDGLGRALVAMLPDAPGPDSVPAPAERPRTRAASRRS